MFFIVFDENFILKIKRNALRDVNQENDNVFDEQHAINVVTKNKQEDLRNGKTYL